jgi:hypothetical protein
MSKYIGETVNQNTDEKQSPTDSQYQQIFHEIYL